MTLESKHIDYDKAMDKILVLQHRWSDDFGRQGQLFHNAVHIFLFPFGVGNDKARQGAFDHDPWFALPGFPSGVSPFFADLLYQQPVTLFNDRFVMPFNEILCFQAVVFDALVCKEVYRYCFLTQGITAILLVAEEAYDYSALVEAVGK